MPQTQTRHGDGLMARAACAKPVDLGHLSRFTLGDKELEREVLELFTGQAPVYLERLIQAGSDQDWREAAHTIKGSAGAIGAWQVAHFAAQAEALAPECDADGRRQAIAQLAAAVDEASDFIAGLF